MFANELSHAAILARHGVTTSTPCFGSLAYLGREMFLSCKKGRVHLVPREHYRCDRCDQIVFVREGVRLSWMAAALCTLARPRRPRPIPRKEDGRDEAR